MEKFQEREKEREEKERERRKKGERNKYERILTRNLSSAETFIFYHKLLDLKDFYFPRFEEEEKEIRERERRRNEERKKEMKERKMKKPLDKMQMEGSRKK